MTHLTKLNNSFDCSDPQAFRIDQEAWERIEEKGVEPVAFFCHPCVIAEQPQLLLYYRTVALLLQKGMSMPVGGTVAKS